MYVYNVTVLGFSIGMTFDLAEAEKWKRDTRNAVIERRVYRVQQEVK